MSKATLIALAGGALSAVASLAFLTGSPGAVMFAYVAPLPLLLVGLGYGVTAGTVAGASGLVLSGVTGGVLAGGIYALVNALPAWMVTRQALMRRAGPDGGEEWYPVGDILCWLAVLGAGVFLIVAAASAGTADGVEGMVAALLGEAFTALIPTLNETARRDAVAALAPMFPGAIGTSWMIMTAVNAVMAQAILVRAGRNIRPPQRLSELAVPDWVSWPLVGSAALALIGPGDLGYIGRNLAILMAVPFFFLGLAVVHTLARRVPRPGLMLVIFYLALMFSGWAAMAVAGVGVAESWVGVRRRFAASGGTGT